MCYKITIFTFLYCYFYFHSPCLLTDLLITYHFLWILAILQSSVQSIFSPNVQVTCRCEAQRNTDQVNCLVRRGQLCHLSSRRSFLCCEKYSKSLMLSLGKIGTATVLFSLLRVSIKMVAVPIY